MYYLDHADSPILNEPVLAKAIKDNTIMSQYHEREWFFAHQGRDIGALEEY